MALVVVSGAVANKLYQGGEAWVRLSYLLGLRRLGYRVHFLEQIAPHDCVDAQGATAPFESSLNLPYFRQIMSDFGFADCATLVPTTQDATAVIPSILIDLADAADALLNISGHLAIKPLLRRFRKKVFVDIDPGFTQYWHCAGNAGARLDGHDYYYTIGMNIGATDCPIPTGGIPWRKTRPPVVLSEWPLTPAPSAPLRFTTIANWRGSYGPVQFDNHTFGLKVHEFRKLLTLPSCAPHTFEIALNIDAADHGDLAAFRDGGWKIVSPVDAASTPQRFRQYVQQSGAEFSAAQGVYVQTGSGWFSDRTTRYLASGRPALLQDTGFSRHLPSTVGLVAFGTLDEAVRGAQSIAADYVAHFRAARSIAEEFFNSDHVLGQLMEEVGVTP